MGGAGQSGERGGAWSGRPDAATRLGLLGVSFLNAQPILHGLLSGLAADRMHLQLAPPAELTRRLFEGQADAALAPVAPLATHGGLEVVPGIAIGCDGPVRSVSVVGDCPIEEMDELLLDAASRTSVILTRLIAQARCKGREPRYSVLPAEEIVRRVGGRTGGLLIGDIALTYEHHFAMNLDLGVAWKALTGLPFVFAVWMARPDALGQRDCLALQGSLEAGLRARPQLARAWARGHGGDADDHLSYLTESIRYTLDDASMAGLQEFLARAAAARLLPPTELRFVASAGAAVRAVRAERAERAAGTAPTAGAQTQRPQRDVAGLLDFAAKGGRLSFQDGLLLAEHAPLHALGLAADTRRRAVHPGDVATYAIDGEVHYTNVCKSACSFCALRRDADDPDAFVLSREQLGKRVEAIVQAGGRSLLLQGGLNPRLHLEWFEDLFRWLKASYPITLQALSPEEVRHLARIEDTGVEAVLRRLQAAGLDVLPGSGAEVLTDRVRRRIAPDKCSCSEWVEVMRAAHRLGLPTTASMMFGTVDTLEDRVLHLLRIRDLQDEAGGIHAFVAWDYQRPTGSALPAGDTGAASHLRTLSMARLMLDNVPHVQSAWGALGHGVARAALHYGCDDLLGSQAADSFLAAAGVAVEAASDDIERGVRAEGFGVARRDLPSTSSTSGTSSTSSTSTTSATGPG